MPTSDTVTVKFVADTAGATKAVDKLRTVIDRSSKSVTNSGKTASGASRHMRNFGSSVVLVNGPLSGLGARAAALNAVVGRSGIAMAGLAATLALVALAFVKLSNAAAENERQMGRIGALLRSTGGAARISAADLELFAESLGRSTLQSKQGVLDAAGALLTFKSISGDVFTRVLTLAADVSEVMGQDLRSSVIQLAKALDAPAQNLSNLRRIGISFTKSQEKMIKELDKSGKKFQAQGKILEIIEGQLGGAGAGANVGVIGAADNLSESWSRLLVTLGKTTGVGEVVAGALRTLERATTGFEETIDPLDQLIRAATQIRLVAEPLESLEEMMTLDPGEGLGKVRDELIGITEASEEALEPVEAITEAVRVMIRAQAKISGKGVVLFPGRAGGRDPTRIDPEEGEKEVDEVFERRLKDLQLIAEGARKTSRELFILGKQIALKAVGDAEQMARVAKVAGEVFDETQKAARDKRFVSGVIKTATALTDVRLETELQIDALGRFAEAELEGARASEILTEQLAIEQKLKAAQGLKPLTDDQKAFAAKKATETVTRRAAVESIKLNRELVQEEKTLRRLITAQQASNHERLVVTRQIQIESDLRAAGVKITEAEIEASRIRAEQLVKMEEQLRKTTAATTDWAQEIDNLTQGTLQGYATGLLDVARGTSEFGVVVAGLADNILNKMAELAADEVFRVMFLGEEAGGGNILKDIGRSLGLDKLFPELFKETKAKKTEAEALKELGEAASETAETLETVEAGFGDTTRSMREFTLACQLAAECLHSMCPAGAAGNDAMLEAARGTAAGLGRVGTESEEFAGILDRTTSRTDDMGDAAKGAADHMGDLADKTAVTSGAMETLSVSALGAAGALSAIAGSGGGGGGGGSFSDYLGLATFAAGAYFGIPTGGTTGSSFPALGSSGGSTQQGDIDFSNTGNLDPNAFPGAGFAHEGDLRVGGAAGIDANIVSLRATRGEVISVRNPNKENARNSGITLIVKNNITTGVVGTVRAELAQQLPEITRFTTRAVLEGIERGGAAARIVRRRQ